MKKILFIMPFMAISLLASCGGNTSKKYFTVKFFDANDKVIQTIENVVSGSKVEFTGDIPTKESSEPSKKYKFRDWDKDINQPITEYTEFRPLYDDINLFKVTFLDYDGTILKGGDAIPYYVEENTKPEAPNDPSREKIEGITYKFAGWDPEVKEISGPITYTAKYTESYETYNVTFSIPNGAVLYENDVQTVIYNGLATKPKVAPYRPGYSFGGWFSDIDLTNPFDFETKHIKGTTTIYSKWEVDPKFTIPLCFTSNVDGNTLTRKVDFYYKTDLNAEWELGDETELTLNEGEKVYIGGDDNYSPYNYNFALPTKSYNASGNIMSLINHTDFKFLYEVGEEQFYKLFQGSISKVSHIVDASDLLLPATKLAKFCYQSMFLLCEALVKAPPLPAITLADGCYDNMFWKCTSLAEAPELPATTLADRCYKDMFSDCLNLIEAPELPATTLVERCYYNMFVGCENLIKAPELPATTLVEECYYNMFGSCKNINYIKVGFGDGTNWPEAEKCTNYWLDDVSSIGTFVWRGSPDGPSKGRSRDTVPAGWDIQTY